jgi:hypothetical protein
MIGVDGVIGLPFGVETGTQVAHPETYCSALVGHRHCISLIKRLKIPHITAVIMLHQTETQVAFSV